MVLINILDKQVKFKCVLIVLIPPPPRINLSFWGAVHLLLPWFSINTYFSLRAKCWLRGGVGGQFPRNLYWSPPSPCIRASRGASLIHRSHWYKDRARDFIGFSVCPLKKSNFPGPTDRNSKHVTVKWTRAGPNYIALIPSRSIRQILVNFLGLNFRGLSPISGKEKESLCLAFTFYKKCEIRHFHIVVVH